MELCHSQHLSRSAYYHWLNPSKSRHELENEMLADKIVGLHNQNPEMGYRRLRDELITRHGAHVNDKRVLRLARYLKIRSILKNHAKGCTRSANSPYCTAENLLNREFHAERPNEKWLTDVTELKYYVGNQVHKLYLSAILDLYDRRIVAYELSVHNDNKLVMNMLKKAGQEEPDAHPLFHSDRGFQYTSREFAQTLRKAGMRQSMSRVGCCLDNGPMEGYWGILKREMYYRRQFISRESLIEAIEKYIYYYNTKRLQRKLSIMTPMEYHAQYYAA